MTRIVAWNIMLGGGTRLPGVKVLRRLDADVVVLSETRSSRLPELVARLEEVGFEHVLAGPITAPEHGVLAASRLRSLPVPSMARPFRVAGCTPSAKRCPSRS